MHQKRSLSGVVTTPRLSQMPWYMFRFCSREHFGRERTRIGRERSDSPNYVSVDDNRRIMLHAAHVCLIFCTPCTLKKHTTKKHPAVNLQSSNMASEDKLANCIGGRDKHLCRRFIKMSMTQGLDFFCEHPESVDHHLACKKVVYICYACSKYAQAYNIRDTTGHANQSTLTQLMFIVAPDFSALRSLGSDCILVLAVFWFCCHTSHAVLLLSQHFTYCTTYMFMQVKLWLNMEQNTEEQFSEEGQKKADDSQRGGHLRTTGQRIRQCLLN